MTIWVEREDPPSLSRDAIDFPTVAEAVDHVMSAFRRTPTHSIEWNISVGDSFWGAVRGVKMRGTLTPTLLLRRPTHYPEVLNEIQLRADLAEAHPEPTVYTTERTYRRVQRCDGGWQVPHWQQLEGSGGGADLALEIKVGMIVVKADAFPAGSVLNVVSTATITPPTPIPDLRTDQEKEPVTPDSFGGSDD